MPVGATVARSSKDAAEIARTYSVNKILGARWGALVLDIGVCLAVFVALSIVARGGNWVLAAWGVFIGAYFIIMEGKWGATLGKMGTKIRVVDRAGQPPGYGRAFVRMLLRLVEVNPLLFGGISAALAVWSSSTRQRLGDMAAATYVLFAEDVGRLAAVRAQKHEISVFD